MTGYCDNPTDCKASYACYTSGCRGEGCQQASASYTRKRRLSKKDPELADIVADLDRTPTEIINAQIKLNAILAQRKWVERANCRDADTDTFYVNRGETKKAATAKALCAECGVRVECLEFALTTSDLDGIWGGLNYKQRAKLKRSRR